ncbi:MAG: response regulator transcription factor [Actinomycetota bacterium]|nr:response regulator transcription factor [Actinomycetota bacterium]
MGAAGQSTAVVVDEWPLVRLGMAQTLRAAGVAVVAEVAHGEEGVRLAGAHGVTHLVLGAHRDLPAGESARRAKALPQPPRLLVLIDQIAREDLGDLRGAGVDALLPRSVGPAELVDAVKRVGAGERVVAPALLSLLVGVLAPVAATDEGATGPGAARGEALTRKELEVLARLAEGRSNREIAEALFVTPATVKSHLAHIYVKLGVTGRQEAMARAVALGLLS